MAETVMLTNRVINEKHAHLVALANCTLPDTQSENLVARLVHKLTPAIQARQKRMKPLEERRQRYVALSEDERTEQLGVWIKLQQDIEAVWEETVEVAIPARKLVDANFPQKLKKASGVMQGNDGNSIALDGAANARGNSAAKAALAPEYYEFEQEGPELVEDDDEE